MTHAIIDARADDGNVLVCFSHLRWKFVYQRPQHLISRAARNHRAFFFEEPLFEECDKAYLRLQKDTSGVTIVEPVLPLGSSLQVAWQMRSLLDGLIRQIGAAPAVMWYYTPMALEFSRHLRGGTCVYDNMDELSAFRGASPKLLSLEQELFERADIVFTGGQSLFEAKRHRHGNIHPFPSSVDFAHFAQARRLGPEPEDQQALPGPRLGFFGVIDERMDVALVEEIARRRPEWQLVMIGPVVKIDPESLPRRPNIAWLGMKSYADLPSYLSGWNVGIMPFAINEATKFISPTKTPEYLAAGIPVVSTAITDVIDPYGRLGLAEIADDAQGFIEACERLFRVPRRRWLERVDYHLSGGSWDHTWSAMNTLIQAARSSNEETPRHAVLVSDSHV